MFKTIYRAEIYAVILLFHLKSLHVCQYCLF